MLTVGSPLQWRDSATTLTDSSRGNYRRISIIDDRLVGYLSLGSTQPDSLAIKRLIDEGLSIRDIKKALLKGEFDGRSFFSRQRTYAAQRMVNTGKLPSPAPVKVIPVDRSFTRTPWETGPLAAPAVESLHTETKIEVNTDPSLNTLVRLEHTSINTQARAPEESQVTTGNYWDAADSVRSSRIPADYTHSPQPANTSQASQYIPTESEALFFEGGIAPRVVESSLVTLSSDTPRRPSSSLWSYSTQLPALKAKRRDAQFIAPPLSRAKEPERIRRTYPSSSLWSYSDKHPVVKRGR